jgi:hypothetical protein
MSTLLVLLISSLFDLMVTARSVPIDRWHPNAHLESTRPSVLRP